MNIMTRRIGIVGLVVAATCCGLLAWRLFRAVTVPVYRPTPAPADIGKLKTDMCRLAQAELRYFNAVGRYASVHELRSDGDFSLPPDTRWPYEYFVRTTAGNFFIVAVAQAAAPAGAPRALTLDASMEIRDATGSSALIARCEDKPRGVTPESVSGNLDARLQAPFVVRASDGSGKNSQFD